MPPRPSTAIVSVRAVTDLCKNLSEVKIQVTDVTANRWLPEWIPKVDANCPGPIGENDVWRADVLKSYAHHYLMICVNVFRTHSDNYATSESTTGIEVNKRNNRTSLTQEERSTALSSDAVVVTNDANFIQCWDDWVKYFHTSRTYERAAANRRWIRDRPIRAEFKDDPEIQAKIALAEKALDEAIRVMTDARRSTSRKAKTAKRKVELQAPRKKYTVAERNAALETAKAVPSIIIELVDEALADSAPPPPDEGNETDDDEDFIDASDLHMFASDDEEDVREELLQHRGVVQETLQRLRGATGRSGVTGFTKASLTAPIEDLEEPVQKAVTFPAEGHNPFPGVNVGEVRKGYINFLKRPVDLEDEIAQDHKDNGGWVCSLCKKYSHVPERTDVRFSNRQNLMRHMRNQHDEWIDLELSMLPNPFPVDPRDIEFTCPSEDFSSHTGKVVRKHMVHDCVNQKAHT